MNDLIAKSNDYIQLLDNVKKQIISSKIKASRAVNKELINLYLSIGKEITKKQEINGFGKSVVEILSKDLKKELGEIKGYSSRNLWDMRRFYLEYKENSNLRHLVAEIPWGHNLLIMNKIKNENERGYYIKATIKNGWTRKVLDNQIKADAYKHYVLSNKQNNFIETLPEYLAEQATNAMKDIYTLEFLGIDKPILEKEIELKIGDFKAEYSLRGLNKPMGVSEYTLTNKLPNELRGSLPTIEDLKKEVFGDV